MTLIQGGNEGLSVAEEYLFFNFIFGSYNSKAPSYLTTTICFPFGLQQTIKK